MTPEEQNLQAILSSTTYMLAEQDIKLLARHELRPVRLQLELLKPELAFHEQNVVSTIVVYGSTRILERSAAEERLLSLQDARLQQPNDVRLERAIARAERVVAKSHYYDEAREFARIVSQSNLEGRSDYIITTGGGPGLMAAANRGAFEVGAKTIGLNISIPAEQVPNPYVTPSLCFQFHYFALRKMHFLLRAQALVAFPGGFGTLDEFFDAITLRQTRRMQEIPVIMFGREYWERVIDFQFLADEGTIDDEHLKLVQFADTAQEAFDLIVSFHQTESTP